MREAKVSAEIIKQKEKKEQKRLKLQQLKDKIASKNYTKEDINEIVLALAERHGLITL